MPMKVYHLTKAEYGKSILAEGFRESTGFYYTSTPHTGMWVSDKPLAIECGLGIDGVVCFEVEIPEDQLTAHEWIEEGKGYREWLVPAALINAFPVREVSEDEWLELF
jgi:hypothetical protein